MDALTVQVASDFSYDFMLLPKKLRGIFHPPPPDILHHLTPFSTYIHRNMYIQHGLVDIEPIHNDSVTVSLLLHDNRMG